SPMNPNNPLQTGTYDSFPSYLDESVTICSVPNNPFKGDFIVTGLENSTYGIHIHMGKVIDDIDQTKTILKNLAANTIPNQRDVYQCEWVTHFTDQPQPVVIQTDKDGDGEFEEIHQVPNPPTHFRGSLGNGTIMLNWQQPDLGFQNTAGYCIYRKSFATHVPQNHDSHQPSFSSLNANSFASLDSNSNDEYTLLTILSNPNQNTFTDTSVQPGHEYSYSIESFDSLGFSSSQSYAGPYRVTESAPSCPNLFVEATPNKTSYTFGEMMYLNVTLRNLGGRATHVTLDVEIPRELTYAGCDKYRATAQGNHVSIAIGNLDTDEVIRFVLYFEVTTDVQRQKSAPVILDLYAKECDAFVRRIVNITLEPKRTGQQNLDLSVKLLNLEFDEETGQYYLPFDQTLEMQLRVEGYQDHYAYTVHWGDGETTSLNKETSATILLKHKFTAKGSMNIKITVQDINGREKTSTLYVTVR
ncbi:MAG: PKD domain-containing protein, partial [Caldisericia bacterium]|nr:PKD domain-containing protein [Caldisericia bacterium]